MSVAEPKKVVINHARKSLLEGQSGKQSQYSQMIVNTQSNHMQQKQDKVSSLYGQERAILISKQKFYRQMHQQSLIKVRLLSEKLKGYGGLQLITDQVTGEISVTQAKIKALQDKLQLKQSKKREKVLRKIQKIVEIFELNTNQSQLRKIKDQFELILFLGDIFMKRYNQLLGEKEDVCKKLDFSLKQKNSIQQQCIDLKQKNMEQFQNVHRLEIQIYNLKHQLFNVSYNKNYDSNYVKLSLLQENIEKLEIQKNRLRAENLQHQQIITEFDEKMRNLKRQIQAQSENNWRQRLKKMAERVQKIERQEQRWKQRYEHIERLKNERIQLLELQCREDRKTQALYTGNWGNQAITTQSRRGINQNPDESDEEYFDLS